MFLTKKLVGLGLIACLGFTVAVPSVSAESLTDEQAKPGADIYYNVGTASGGGEDGDGTLADWTVQYPVAIYLNDGTVSKESGSKVVFKVFDTDPITGAISETPYTGSKTINIHVAVPKTKDNKTQTVDSKGLLMTPITTTASEKKVYMQLANGQEEKSQDVGLSTTEGADSTNPIATLSKKGEGAEAPDTTVATGSAYLSDVDKTVKKKEQYQARVTWSITATGGDKNGQS